MILGIHQQQQKKNVYGMDNQDVYHQVNVHHLQGQMIFALKSLLPTVHVLGLLPLQVIVLPQALLVKVLPQHIILMYCVNLGGLFASLMGLDV